MVKNFLIADLDVKDNFTTYCGITLTPLQTKRESKDWPVSRATDGTVRNCRIFNASPGYGLTQLHGAQSVHFEDIYAKGGVTLRLGTGAVGDKTAIYDISARNVVNEDGRCAVMLGPHSAMNGVVKVDGVPRPRREVAKILGIPHRTDSISAYYRQPENTMKKCYSVLLFVVLQMQAPDLHAAYTEPDS